jgi:hypothetical protein
MCRALLYQISIEVQSVNFDSGQVSATMGTLELKGGLPGIGNGAVSKTVDRKVLQVQVLYPPQCDYALRTLYVFQCKNVARASKLLYSRGKDLKRLSISVAIPVATDAKPVQNL